MKGLSILLLLLSIQALAQKGSVFVIDSLPKQGIVLDQGWKWQAGDDLAWAKPDFDDSNWENIDPTLDVVDSLPQIPRPSGICWFRLRIKVDKKIASAILAFAIMQSGASEIYINGKLVREYGTVSANSDQIRAYDPLKEKPIPFYVPQDSTIVLAVRYTLQPDITYTLTLARQNPVLKITCNYLEVFHAERMASSNRIQHSLVFRIGAFSILLIVYFALYLYYPTQKANLFFCLASLCVIIADVASMLVFGNHNVGDLYLLFNLSFAFSNFRTIFILVAVHFLLEQKRNWFFWTLIILAFWVYIPALFIYHWGILWPVLFGNLINLEIVRITLKSIQSHKKGAWIIAVGGLSFFAFWLVFFLSLYFGFIFTTLFGSIYTIGDFTYNLSLLSIPLAVSIYAGMEVAVTNRSLKLKLVEVETLSTEKQRILSDQNQTLEKQVAERTAELTQKNLELEIEAALERVRTSALSMQRSNEVLNVAATLYEELQKLDFTFGIIGINLIDAQTGDMESWVAGFGQDTYPQSYSIPYFDHPFQKSAVEAWRNGSTYLVYELTGAEKKEYDDFMFTQSGYKAIPDDVKARMMATEQVTFSLAFMKHGALLWAPEPLTEEKAEVFQRFAKVFEQAYVRFLDLQLKEQQANRLIEEKQKLETTLLELRSTQAQLIQSEKLASLGELTAGIAHEIQNPLNFVNNFAEVSVEMLGEMKEEINAGNTSEVIAIADDLEQNLSKINHHGQRASSIVKGMLEHSRPSSGVKTPTDLNALTDEYLRLAYHGLRAKDNNFNATMETHFDPDLPLVSVIPQDIGRVLLNLINNAFYAVDEKQKQMTTVASGAPLSESFRLSESYTPTISLRTKRLDNAVEISIKDNGPGIPEAIREKIFQPFFTTKPTGQGTGLGLSLAYDIVTKGHGGTLDVDSTDGSGTVFTLRLNLG